MSSPPSALLWRIDERRGLVRSLVNNQCLVISNNSDIFDLMVMNYVDIDHLLLSQNDNNNVTQHFIKIFKY